MSRTFPGITWTDASPELLDERDEAYEALKAKIEALGLRFYLDLSEEGQNHVDDLARLTVEAREKVRFDEARVDMTIADEAFA